MDFRKMKAKRCGEEPQRGEGFRASGGDPEVTAPQTVL
jgi:hypothetical protein